MTKADLKAIGISDWADIKADFKGADLLLGNGFSMNLSPKFSYTKLFSAFLNTCPPVYKKVFQDFKTTNFELIMQKLLGASTVNQIFNWYNVRICDAIPRLKNGLIKAIKDVHPDVGRMSREVSWQRLEDISKQLDEFNDVFTLNYDLLMYKILMITWERHNQDNAVTLYGDNFCKKVSKGWQQFIDCQANLKNFKYVYYLHGALFLFKRQNVTCKICGGGRDANLMTTIRNEIHSNNLPIFVSEGSSEEKIEAISNSEYLRFALKKLQMANRRLVIFGASLDDPDAHIRDAVTNSVAREPVAYAIYVGNRPENELRKEIRNIQARIYLRDVQFFDSSTIFA